MRIVVVTPGASATVQLEVEPSEVVETVKALVEKELGVPLAEQVVIFQGKVLADGTSLTSAGVAEDDVLTVERAAAVRSDASAVTGGAAPTEFAGMTWCVRALLGSCRPVLMFVWVHVRERREDVPSNVSPEALIRIVTANPPMMQQLRASNPDLAAAIASQDVSRVRSALMMQHMMQFERQHAARMREDNLRRRLDTDPFDIEAQRQLEELIQQKARTTGAAAAAAAAAGAAEAAAAGAAVAAAVAAALTHTYLYRRTSQRTWSWRLSTPPSPLHAW